MPRSPPLTFEPVDEARFPALAIARHAGGLGPRATAALIAADEVAVERFLAGSLSLPGIWRLAEAAVDRFGEAGPTLPGLDEVLALDAEVRAFSRAFAGTVRDRWTSTTSPTAPINIVLVLAILVALVVIHEFGHFVDGPPGRCAGP